MHSTDSLTSLLARSSLNQDNHRHGCDLERISDYQAMVFGHNSFIHVRGNNMLGSFPLTATGSLTLQVQQLHHQAIRLYGIEMLPSYWIGTSHSCQQYCSCRLLQELLKKCEAPGSSNHSNFIKLGSIRCKYVETTIARNHKEPTTIINEYQWIISNLNKPRRKSENPGLFGCVDGTMWPASVVAY